MKIIYSVLKQEFLPQLTVNPKILANDLAMIGHFVSGIEQIGKETIIDLEIRQNRGDCLGYYGLARDLSVLYDIPLTLPNISDLHFASYQLPITVSSSDVRRIQAVKISGVHNSVSPPWLTEFLNLHQINSVNTIVDLTNYIMFLWGMPNHAFDVNISTDNLIWENNSKYSNLITLDGSDLKLPPRTLIISNPSKVLSLSFLGGQECAIQLNTTNIIIEVAVYNRSRVKNDSRTLKTTTEAEIRLDKELDTELVPLVLGHLTSLICNLTGGQISSQLFDYYPEKTTPKPIEFDPEKPSLYAGVTIPENNILERLGCTINGNLITPPSIRKDIAIEEDLIEEVIRFHGYQQIPSSQPLPSKKLTDITPKVLYLIEQLKDELVSQGFDEVRSWPLVKTPIDDKAIRTQNSINSEYPYLRQSIIQSLKDQLEQYSRYKLPLPKFFEIGKIFYLENGHYTEKYALGTYDGCNFQETILDSLQPPDDYLPQITDSQAIELNSQIITLDANVSSDKTEQDLLDEYRSRIDHDILWSISIIGQYQNKYTFRVSYYNCDDKTAKRVHLSAFKLTTLQKK